MGTKKGRIFGKGAPFKGAPRGLGEHLPQTPPLDPPLLESNALFCGKLHNVIVMSQSDITHRNNPRLDLVHSALIIKTHICRNTRPRIITV